MNLQNSALEISASLMMSGTQKGSFGPYSEKLVNFLGLILKNWSIFQNKAQMTHFCSLT